MSSPPVHLYSHAAFRSYLFSLSESQPHNALLREDTFLCSMRRSQTEPLSSEFAALQLHSPTLPADPPVIECDDDPFLSALDLPPESSPFS